jgi:septal ring-binding cell division protein DamX
LTDPFYRGIDDSENIPILFFATKCTKMIYSGLKLILPTILLTVLILKPGAKAGKSTRIENNAWIRKQNSKHFTLQLAAVSSEQAIKNVIKKHTQPGIFAYYRKKHKGRDLYIAIYGDFSNRVDAEKATGHFAPLKPWIREFGSIQEIIVKK